MFFSCVIFIFVFLPTILLLYYFTFRRNRQLQNYLLTISSLLFYAWGEPTFVIIMILSICINWFLALKVDIHRNNLKLSKLIITICFILNLGVLFIFKYSSFFISNINLLFQFNIKEPEIKLPIGISFFTFQAMSYVFDVYRQNGKVQKSLWNVALYISFFPQLIAGPIVRYKTISDQIDNRKESINLFGKGVQKFLIGLFKKVLIANNMAIIVDYVFGLPLENVTSSAIWIAVILYSFQIYFDFSGYSDMAIGLGKMFGFKFLENFNYPYISKSVSEFWRRWHISLGNWFRDYVYFPLGGSRVESKTRLIFNLFVVWFFTGMWHGANWTFILWGLFYWVILVIEKLFKNITLKLEKSFFGWLITMFFVLIGWTLFRSENIESAFYYIKKMIILNNFFTNDNYLNALIFENYIFIISAFFFSTPILQLLSSKIKFQKNIINFSYMSMMFFLFILCISFLVKGAYNPFIYFNF